MKSMEEEFSASARELGLALLPGHMDILLAYTSELLRWNRKINLTAAKDAREILFHHILDSLALLSRLPAAGSLVDLGSGAGFPAIPIKIMRPGLDMLLVESRRKKVSFLNHVIGLLGLKGIEALWCRAEEAAAEESLARDRFDLLVSRAALQDELVLRTASGLMGPEGKILLMKGALEIEEVSELQRVFHRGNWDLAEAFVYGLPHAHKKRTLVVFQRGQCFT